MGTSLIGNLATVDVKQKDYEFMDDGCTLSLTMKPTLTGLWYLGHQCTL